MSNLFITAHLQGDGGGRGSENAGFTARPLPTLTTDPRQRQRSRTLCPPRSTTFKATAPSPPTSPQPEGRKLAQREPSALQSYGVRYPRAPGAGRPRRPDGRRLRGRGVDKGHLCTWPDSDKAGHFQPRSGAEGCGQRPGGGAAPGLRPPAPAGAPSPPRPGPLPGAPCSPPPHPRPIHQPAGAAHWPGPRPPPGHWLPATQSPPPQRNLAYGGPRGGAPPPGLPAARRCGGAASAAHRVVGEQPCIVVQHEPTVLPALHHVSPLAQRPFHDGRHLGSRQ